MGGTLGRRAHEKRTALIWAAAYGYADCARLLLDAGADKEAKMNVRARADGGVRGVGIQVLFLDFAIGHLCVR